MTFNLQKNLDSKHALRRDLAVLPIGEKLPEWLNELNSAFAA